MNINTYRQVYNCYKNETKICFKNLCTTKYENQDVRWIRCVLICGIFVVDKWAPIRNHIQNKINSTVQNMHKQVPWSPLIAERGTPLSNSTLHVFLGHSALYNTPYYFFFLHLTLKFTKILQHIQSFLFIMHNST